MSTKAENNADAWLASQFAKISPCPSCQLGPEDHEAVVDGFGNKSVSCKLMYDPATALRVARAYVERSANDDPDRGISERVFRDALWMLSQANLLLRKKPTTVFLCASRIRMARGTAAAHAKDLAWIENFFNQIEAEIAKQEPDPNEFQV